MQEEWSPDFPIHLYHSGMVLPKEGNYFVIAGDGIWLHKDTGICQCFVPVENISCLDNLNAKSSVSVNLPKLPIKFVWQIKHFFKLVVEKMRSEAEVNIYYNPLINQYKIHVPEQIVSYGSVKYKIVGTIHLGQGIEDYLRVGTIHSHCDFSAFHSDTDVKDELYFDGLHVTFGNNDKDSFTISASVAVNGFRKKVHPSSVLEGIEEYEDCFSIVTIGEIDESWILEVDNWILNFNSKNYTNNLLGLKGVEFVEWSDEMKSSILRSSLGQGPFEVLHKENEMIVIKTNYGTTRLAQCFFKSNGDFNGKN